MKISIVQTNSGSIVADNLAIILKAMTTAVETEAPDLIALPEYALCLTGDKQVAERNAQVLDDSEPVSALASFAASHRTAVHLGSVVERSADGRYYNSSVVFGPSGARLAQYRKRNLFATERPEWRGSVVHNEATFLSAGEAPTKFELLGITCGNSICYDLRFPEIYRTLRAEGATVIFAPSAFTAVTGERDWANLLRARAEETGCYIVAANQCGPFDAGRYESWGHSMIVGPSGEIVAECQREPAILTADLQPILA